MIDLARLKSLLDAATAAADRRRVVPGPDRVDPVEIEWGRALRNSAPALISELESLRARMADAEKVITAVRAFDEDDERGPLFAALAHFDAQEGK